MFLRHSLVAFVISLFCVSCQSRQATSKVSISIKNAKPQTALHAASSVSEFSCFAINIVGPGIGSADETNYPATSTLLKMQTENSPCLYPGKTSPLLSVTSGSTVTTTLEVPTGVNRIVQVLGISGVTCDGNLGQLLAQSPLSVAGVYEVGRKTVDILATQKIEISAGETRHANCVAEDPGMTDEPSAFTIVGGHWKSDCISDGSLLGFAMADQMPTQFSSFTIQSQKIDIDFSTDPGKILVVHYFDTECGTVNTAMRYMVSDVQMSSTPFGTSTSDYLAQFTVLSAEVAAVSSSPYFGYGSCGVVIGNSSIPGGDVDQANWVTVTDGECGQPLPSMTRFDLVQQTDQGLVFTYKIPFGATAEESLLERPLLEKEYIEQ